MAIRFAPTIYDVAREAGVSIATVSRALSGRPHVSAKALASVQAAAERLHFRPNALARELGKGEGRTLGILLPEVTQPYYAALYTAADDEARENGYSTILHRLPQRTLYQPHALDALIESRLAGILFLGGMVEGVREEVRALLDHLQRLMPVVAICSPMEEMNCICLHNDMASCTRKAVRHLYMLGHRRIAYLGGENDLTDSGGRGVGFLEESRALGLPEDSSRLHEGGYTPEAGEMAVLKILSSTEASGWPTALIAINDLVALGALKQLRRMGLRVPEDMAVIGCDNQFFSAYTDPPLTTIDLHPAEHARSAMQELLNACKTQTAPFVQTRETTMIIRESCGAPLGPRELTEIRRTGPV